LFAATERQSKFSTSRTVWRRAAVTIIVESSTKGCGVSPASLSREMMYS